MFIKSVTGCFVDAQVSKHQCQASCGSIIRRCIHEKIYLIMRFRLRGTRQLSKYPFSVEPIPVVFMGEVHCRALTDGRGSHTRCQIHIRSSRIHPTWDLNQQPFDPLYSLSYSHPTVEFENLDEQHLEITLRKGSLSIGVFSKMVSDTSSVQFAQLFFTSDSGHA